MPPHILPPKPPEGPPRPKRLRDYPRWIAGMISSLFSHLAYIVRLVHETRPWLLYLMGFFCLFGGVLPVVGAWITRDLLNAVALLLTDGGATPLSGVAEELFGRFRTVTFLILFEFIYLFLNSRFINEDIEGIPGAPTELFEDRGIFFILAHHRAVVEHLCYAARNLFDQSVWLVTCGANECELVFARRKRIGIAFHNGRNTVFRSQQSAFISIVTNRKCEEPASILKS